jgi:hypothetical protein
MSDDADYKKPRPIRSLPGDFSKEIRAYAARTGLALWAWNTLHANLFLLFWFITSRGHGTYHATAHRLWHTIQSDATQRKMLLNLATANLANPLLGNVRWIIQTTNRLSTYRNIAGHTPAVFSPYYEQQPTADPASAREHAHKRFNEIKHNQFWRLLVGDLISLSTYTGAVATEIQEPGFGGPLPRKPRMQCLAQIARIEGEISRLAQSEERSRQQFASEARRLAEVKRRGHSGA